MAMCAATTLVFSAMSVMPASAADTFDIVATADKTSFEAGDTVTITVSAKNNPGVNCWAVALNYDKSVFEYDYELEDNLMGVTDEVSAFAKDSKEDVSQPFTDEELPLPYSWSEVEHKVKGKVTGDPYTTTGTMFTITLKVKDDAKPGNYEIELVTKEGEVCVNQFGGDPSQPISERPCELVNVPFTTTNVDVTVEGPQVPATALAVTPEKIEVFKAGVNTAIKATVTPADSTDTVTYKSSNTGVATVDSTGVVTSVAEGAATITVTAGKLSKTVDVTVHVLTKVEAKAATCKAAGNIEYYKCACGKLYEDAEGAKETTAAKVTIPKLAHDFTKKVMSDKTLKSKGTCVKKAVYYYTCAACGEVSTDKTFEGELDATNHENTELKNVVKPDYFVNGYTGDTYCKDCGVLIKKGEVDPMLLPEKVAAKAPTCTEAGNKEYYKGGDKLYTSDDPATAKETTLAEVTIPATGHDYDAPTYEFSADRKTCTATRVCKNDKTHVETETVDVVETVITEPTYDAEGESTYTATFTNPAFEKQEITEKTAALVHTYEAVNAVEPTCTENGNKAYYIRDDGKLFVDQAGTEEVTAEDVVIPATGHDWELDPDSVKFNDDFTVCQATLKCKNDASHVEDIETTNIEIVEDVESTCSEAGYTKYLANFDNGMTAEYKADKDVLEHTWGEWEVVEEATEEEDGLKKRTCEVCGAEEEEVIPALGSEEEPADDEDGKADKKEDKGSDAATTTTTSNPVTGTAAALGLVAAALGSLAIFKKRK